MATVELLESLSRKNGFSCTPPPEISVEKVVLCVGKLIGMHSVIAASRMNQRVVIFVAKEEMVAQLVESGLTVEPDIFLFISPLDVPSMKVLLSNIPPFIKNEQVKAALEQYGTVVSKITFIPVRFKDHITKHILSFRRQLFIIPKPNIRELDVMLKIEHEKFTYRIFATSQTLVCYKCGQYGHMKNECPRGVEKESSKVENVNEPEVTGVPTEAGENSENQTNGKNESGWVTRGKRRHQNAVLVEPSSYAEAVAVKRVSLNRNESNQNPSDVYACPLTCDDEETMELQNTPSVDVPGGDETCSGHTVGSHTLKHDIQAEIVSNTQEPIVETIVVPNTSEPAVQTTVEPNNSEPSVQTIVVPNTTEQSDQTVVAPSTIELPVTSTATPITSVILKQTPEKLEGNLLPEDSFFMKQFPMSAISVKKKEAEFEHESCDSDDTCSISDSSELDGAAGDSQDHKDLNAPAPAKVIKFLHNTFRKKKSGSLWRQ